MKLRFTLLIIIVLIFSAGCHRISQNTEMRNHELFAPDSLCTPTGSAPLDQLLHIITTAPIDTNLAILYHEIGERYEDIDDEKAIYYYQKLKNLSEHLNWNEGTYRYATAYSNLLIRKGTLDPALMALQKGYDLAVQENNEAATANMIFNIGNVYFMKEWFPQALSCYSDALTIYEKRNDTDKRQTIYWMMTLIYQTIGDIDMAIECGEKSIALNNENPYSFLCLALAYQAANMREKSITNYEEALRLATLQDNIYLQGTIYNYFANEALLVLDLERAESYAHKSLEVARIFGPAWCATCYIVLSKVEELRNNTDKSKEYAKEAQQIAEELNALEEKKLGYFFLAEICYAHREYSDHSRYYVEWDVFDVMRVARVTYNAAEEMFTNYLLSKKDLEIELQKNVIAKQEMQRNFFVVGIMVCVLLLIVFWYILRLRRRRNRALAELNATKDKFFSIISHDLKNPAIAQRDAIKMLFTKAGQWDATTLHDFSGELLNSADMQVDLLYKLLSWAQLQSGRMIYQPETIDLALIMVPEIALIRKIADNKGVQLETEIAQPCIVTADAEMIATVVRNLLSNAVKFTPAGGTVKLEISESKISISDTGAGMSPTEMQNIFRLDSSHSKLGTAGETGTGLGLIVCRELLEKHNTKLQVESEKGCGSRFWFEI